MNDFKIISIFGASASGKSSLARALEESNPQRFSRVPADRLIKDKLSNDENYFKKPIEYDWEHLKSLLSNKKIGEEVSLPLFDYSTFTRSADTSDKKFIITEYLLIDSIAPYSEADLLFYVNVPIEVRKERMLKRDLSQNTNIQERWEWFIVSDDYNRNAYIKKSIVLDGTKTIDELAKEVKVAISQI